LKKVDQNFTEKGNIKPPPLGEVARASVTERVETISTFSTASATSCLPKKNTAATIDASIMVTAAFFFAQPHGWVAVGRGILRVPRRAVACCRRKQTVTANFTA